MNLEVLSSKYINKEQTVIDLIIKDNDEDIEFPFCYVTNSNDDAPVTLFVKDLLLHGKIIPDKYIEPKRPVNEIAYDIRRKRTSILNNTDYFMNPDYPISDENRSMLKYYRQALRDIPQQEGFPENVVWPTPPEFLN